MHISLLFGTETGNTEMLCEDLQDALDPDHDILVANLEDVDPSALSSERFYIFVCSTYGEGELPQSALPFAEKLKTDTPDLSALRFAIFGFGDSTYEATYNNGSVVLTEVLTQAGAQVIGPRGLHDASGLEDPIDVALPWARERITEAGAYFED